MKNRNSIAIFTTILSALACFGFAFGAAGPESPDPSPFPVNSNTADGYKALASSDNAFNSAYGWFSLFTNTSAFFNTGFGAGTLFNNNGPDNTAVGAAAMFFNTTGNDNTAVGINALRDNTSGYHNTAVGAAALFSNTAGAGNTAVGGQALQFNTAGLFSTNGANTAVGRLALFNNTTGGGNVAVGTNITVGTFGALGSNTTGTANTAIGQGALASNTTGSNNTAVGFVALENATGNFVTAIGAGAGAVSPSPGDNDIYIGDTGGPGESNVIAIGNSPSSGTSYTACYIGSMGTNVFIPGINVFLSNLAPGVPTALTPVFIDVGTGQLSAGVSSARFKKDIKPMDKTSESILALNPVTFHYKNDDKGIPQFGLVAEDVAKVNPNLVVGDADGKPYTVRYDAVNAMLLNEFIKEHKKVQDLEATVAQQQKGMEVLTAQLKEQAAQIQKVSAQLEANKPAPQVVNNP